MRPLVETGRYYGADKLRSSFYKQVVPMELRRIPPTGAELSSVTLAHTSRPAELSAAPKHAPRDPQTLFPHIKDISRSEPETRPILILRS